MTKFLGPDGIQLNKIDFFRVIKTEIYDLTLYKTRIIKRLSARTLIKSSILSIKLDTDGLIRQTDS